MISLKTVGEFGLIERFKKSIKTDPSVIKGSGDDCAVLKYSKDKYQLFSCDMLVGGVDFFSGEKPYLVGRKSVAVSLSDIAACGGVPRYCVISIGIPRNTPLKFMDALFKGMHDISKEYKLNIVGGDISKAEKLTIDVSILGIVEKRNLVLRGGAKKDDYIFVTGELGGSIRGRHLCFTPRVNEARFLVRNFKMNSMIDISDGLAQDLRHILKESSKGAIIYEDLVPLSEDAMNIKEGFYMGEDFELLFSMSPVESARLNKYIAKKKINFSVNSIGRITDKESGVILVKKNGDKIKLAQKGFRHF